MVYNNTVTLIGNTGGEVRIRQTQNDKPFASFSLATTDSYKDDKGEWQDKETVWHEIIAFNPQLVESLRSFPKGTRLEVIGELSYRPFETTTEDGQIITKKEATIIAKKVEEKPLRKKAAA